MSTEKESRSIRGLISDFKTYLVWLLLLSLVCGCLDEEVPECIEELRHETKHMSKIEKVEAICRFETQDLIDSSDAIPHAPFITNNGIPYTLEEYVIEVQKTDCRVVKIETDCEHHFILCLGLHTTYIGGEVTYYTHRDFFDRYIVGSCDLIGNRCTAFVDLKTYWI